jgi:hypothetical protein
MRCIAVRWAGLAIAATLLVALLAASAVSAKTYVVTRSNDPAPGPCKAKDCSVREAIKAANNHAGKDVVVLPKRRPHYVLARPNAAPVDDDQDLTGDLDTTGPVTIRHPGRGVATIDANGIDRVLDVQPGAATKLVRIKVTGGDHPFEDAPKQGAGKGPGSVGDGGGISSLAPLKLVRSAVVGNVADGAGGIESGDATLTLVRSQVSHNRTVSGVSGGVDLFDNSARIVRSKITHNHAANAGGGLSTDTVNLRITKSTVADNVADEGATGVYLYNAVARISQSTISGNVAHNNTGGGIELSNTSTLAMVNSTVTRNRADLDGGGIEADLSAGNVTLNSVTIGRNVADADGNASGTGGGINIEPGNTATFDIVNSIVALNHAGGSPNDCFGPFTSGGGNLLGTLSVGCTGFGGSDLIGVNPKLGSLANNGGPTKTLALKKGSPAIGNAVKSRAPRRDQRGKRRDKHPDSGAFERLK